MAFREQVQIRSRNMVDKEKQEVHANALSDIVRYQKLRLLCGMAFVIHVECRLQVLLMCAGTELLFPHKSYESKFR
jgi:hypothetical protein